MEQDPKSSSLALKTMFLVYVTNVTKLVSWTYAGLLAQANTPYLG